MVNKIDRRGKKKRFIFVITEFDICIVQLDKNKDKNTRRQNPFAYTIFRRIPFQNFQSITFSTMADNFFDLKVKDEPDSLLENRKKTEIIAAIKKASPQTQILFNDTFTIELKKKKRTQFSVQMQQDAPDGGMVKGKSIKVPPGIGKDAYPDIKEPTKVEHTRTTGYGKSDPKKMDMPPPTNFRDKFPPPRRGGMPPRNTEPEDDNGDDQDYNPPPRRGPSRLPPRNTEPEDNDEDQNSNPPPRRITGRMLPLPRRTPPPM